MSEPSAQPRLHYVDWLRGVAVLIMIEAHVLDAWTRLPDRLTIAYRHLTVLGGFAAPLFLALAGMSLVLSSDARSVRDGTRRAAGEAVVARGAEVFILAFLFRIQAFIVTPGSALVTLFRVDILNVMGPGIAMAGLIWIVTPTRAAFAAASGLAAIGTAMATPVLRVAPWIDWLPIWFQWYLRPAGEHTTFTLFPWVGFVFAGAAGGALLAAGRARGFDKGSLGGLATAGALLAVGGFYAASLPTIYRASSFWTTSPAYFAIRTGVVFIAVGLAFALTPVARRLPGPFAIAGRFGRRSLFVYWIHVELVYGYASWGIRHRLPLWGTLAAYTLFCALLYGAILLWERAMAAWQRRESRALAAEPSLRVQ